MALLEEALRVCFEISKAHARPSVSFSLLPEDPDIELSVTSPQQQETKTDPV